MARDKDPNASKDSGPRMAEHEYDGIQEYDNPMPRWWLLSFAATIVFSVIYLFNVGPVGNGNGRIADYEADMKAFAAAHPAPTNNVTPDVLLALTKDASAVAQGQKTYTAYCASCHRADGGGLIGPNLTDSYWLHGAALTDVYRTVDAGVLEKGMPPWGKVLKPADMQAVVAYVSTLQGTNPPNPKAPQGVQATP